MTQKAAPRPLKIFFAGIDGSGKSTCLDLLISRLDKHCRILKIGADVPEVFWQGKKERICDNFLYRSAGNTPAIYGSHRLRGLFVICRFLSNFFVGQYVRRRDKSDIIMCETDTLLHPCAYVTYYHPWTKKIKNSVRFAIVNGLFGPGKNSVIFYLDTEPTIAMERIQKRNTTFDRHENIDDLQALKKELDDMVEIALKSGVAVCKIDTDHKSLETVCQEVERVLKSRFFLSKFSGVTALVGPVAAACIKAACIHL